MKLTSPVFENNKMMPSKFTVDGQGVNPPLDIENIPAGAKSLALIVDDPDAPSGDFVHWVVYDIPVVNKIEENSVPGKEGINTTGGKEYVPPAPPFGTHRYVFKIYALDEKLALEGNINKKALEKTMQAHMLDKVELIGLYKRKSK